MRSLLLCCAVAMVGCGPDAAALVGADGSDVDQTESQEAGLTTSNKVSVWFPMHDGDTWTFKSTTTSATRTVKLSQVGSGMGLLQGLGDDLWVGTNANTTNTLYAWDGSAWKVYLRFGYSNTVWSYGSGTCTGFKLKRSSTGTTITTPAGAFSDTRSIALMQISDPVTLCPAPALSEDTFVPNVGLVGFKTGKGERFTLKSATVGGQPVGGLPVDASVTLDAASYISTPNTIQCITTPCPSNEKTASAKVRFQLVNTGPDELTWQFTSGCQVDVDLLSASGTVVSRYLEMQMCTAVMSTLRLSAGQRKTWTLDMPLADRSGNQLDGDFTVRARLVASGGGAVPSATAPLSVSVAP
jgi:hypothetical protein